MMSNFKVVFFKEYLQRLRTPAFWITTFLVPLLMVGITLLPALLAVKSKSNPTVVVIDNTHQILPLLKGQKAFHGISLIAAKGGSLSELKERVLNKEIDGYLVIPAKALEGEKITYYARNVADFKTLGHLENSLRQVILQLRLKKKGLESAAIEKLLRVPSLETFKVTKKGTYKEKGGTFFLIMLLFLSLYMLIIMYGQFVMVSVLEDKATRIMEILLSSVKPFPMFLGKIFGAGAVGLTQYILWILMGLGAFIFILPSLAALPKEAIPAVETSHVVYFLIFFVLGYFLYASLYAGIGSLFNSQQEAQQASTLLVLPLIVPVILMQVILSQPNSTLSLLLSLIPFFTPLLLYLRIIVETPPFWQILLGILLTAGTTLLVGYLSARIYRVGVLLYGKRPNLKEIITILRTS